MVQSPSSAPLSVLQVSKAGNYLFYLFWKQFTFLVLLIRFGVQWQFFAFSSLIFMARSFFWFSPICVYFPPKCLASNQSKAPCGNQVTNSFDWLPLLLDEWLMSIRRGLIIIMLQVYYFPICYRPSLALCLMKTAFKNHALTFPLKMF